MNRAATSSVGASSEPAPSPAGWRLDLALALAGALLACAWFFRAVLLSRFARVPGDLADSRLLNFLLEHGWLWLRRSPLHRELWGLPMFYPAGGRSFAYSDLLLSFAPPYWLTRAAGVDPHTSYQIWLLLMGLASSLAMFALLRWGLGASRLAAVLGANLAVFSASRLFQVHHAQLWPIVYPLLALLAAMRYARAASAGRRAVLLLAIALCVVLQFYGAFYNGVFTLLLGGILLAVDLLSGDGRGRWRSRLRGDAAMVAGAAALTIVLLAPLAATYLRAQREVGGRSWDEIEPLLPRLASWVYHAPSAPLAGWEKRQPAFSTLPSRDEHALGLGLVTSGLLAAGLIAGWRRPAVRNGAIAMAIAMAAITVYPGGFTPWRFVASYVPGLTAARAMTRIGLVLPLLAGAALAVLVDRAGRRARAWVCGLGLLGLAEQSIELHTFDKQVSRRWIAEIATRVDPGAAAFVVSSRRPRFSQWILQLDAIWATLATERPTLNGYTGNWPPGWGGQLWLARSGSESARAQFAADLAAWLARHQAPPESVQWIELDERYRRGRRWGQSDDSDSITGSPNAR